MGGPLIKLLTAAGHEVTALTRSEAEWRPLRDAGAEPVICDALNSEALRSAAVAAHPQAVVNPPTAPPRRISPRQIGRDLAATSRLRGEGARNLMAAAAAAGAAHVVAQSVAFAYAPDNSAAGTAGGALRREQDPLYGNAPGGFGPAGAAIAELERVTRGSPANRGGWLPYCFCLGPGTAVGACGSRA